MGDAGLIKGDETENMVKKILGGPIPVSPSSLIKGGPLN